MGADLWEVWAISAVTYLNPVRGLQKMWGAFLGGPRSAASGPYRTFLGWIIDFILVLLVLSGQGDDSRTDCGARPRSQVFRHLPKLIRWRRVLILDIPQRLVDAVTVEE